MLFAFSRLGAVVLGIAIALLLHGCGQDDVPSVPQGWVDIYCSCSYNQTSEPNGTFNETNRDSCFAKSADVASRSFSPEDIDLCINESSETCDCVGEERLAVAGRAFLTGNGSCRASIDGGASDGWANFPAGSQAVDPILASHFLDVGIAEHASVASFARVVMEMISLAAPADLLDRTLAAGREEIRHAQMALSLARRWSPEDFRVGPLPGLEFRPVTLMDLANQTVFEAILGETPAALRAAVASSVAQDQHAREFWQLVALEERRHAELAWATVAWAVQAGQVQVQQGVLAALALCTPKPEHSEASGNLRYGLLTPALELEVTREASDLIKRLRSELQTLEDLPGFERRVQEHFAESAKKLQLQVAV